MNDDGALPQICVRSYFQKLFLLVSILKEPLFFLQKKIKVVIYKGQNIKNNFLNKLKIMFNILNFDIV